MISVSAFSCLDAPQQRTLVQGVSRARILPRCCGTYAFYDRQGDLLYIGKAKNVRARVLSHLRLPPAQHFLPPWTRMIAEIEVRPAGSEMEALLVEADLIGRLAPPFNRQMRSWSRYCYLVRTDDVLHPLAISTQLPSWRSCFGPFRSKKQAVAIIESVFRVASHRNGTGGSLEQLYSVLAGSDDSMIAALEQRCEAQADARLDAWTRSLPHITGILRKAFERTALLRDAEQLLGSVLVLPGLAEERTVAVISHQGLHLRTIESTMQSAGDFLAGYRRLTLSAYREGHRLPKAISDCLCVASRQARRRKSSCRVLPRDEASGLTESALLSFVFDE